MRRNCFQNTMALRRVVVLIVVFCSILCQLQGVVGKEEVCVGDVDWPRVAGDQDLTLKEEESHGV